MSVLHINKCAHYNRDRTQLFMLDVIHYMYICLYPDCTSLHMKTHMKETNNCVL